ncbi:hypothetical protein NLJ89_g788 [Agrocybe chaxingu]|uniref:Uncharacterized protein n=1 Tax=Agrocybe chaxingu TaxID=84603 RepID=A0A9W8N176_9AGAR|nr:hypothetical protein NLJ89_g788 [Agrocybe chaxingu]
MPPVKLYVYDLSNGLARQLSRQLTGRQIDGIWHTSVVVFGKEIFYGQGISITPPGRSHHGQPLQILDMGETSLGEDIFNEYLQEMTDHYTADKVSSSFVDFETWSYTRTEFNCNSFTDDCVGFLTGQSVPAFIKDLPSDFLSTPFGAALRPTIDAMYRRPSPGTPSAPIPSPSTAANASPDPQLAASILQAVASQAQAAPAQANGHVQAMNSLTGPLHMITNPTSFRAFLKSHRAAVAFFTSATCPPCRMIEPIFERLAEEKGLHEGRNGAGFAKIDIDVGMGRNLAEEWDIRATPTFMFFLDGKKLDELKGADANELRTQVDLLLFQAYPPHPHTAISLPAVQALSLNAIIFSQVPAFDTVLTKQQSFIDDQTSWPSSVQTKDQVKGTLSGVVLPYLKERFPSTAPDKSTKNLPSATPAILAAWAQATTTMATPLPVESLFPVVDMWRIAFLDPSVGNWMATLVPTTPPTDPLGVFLPKAVQALESTSKGARNYILIVLRLLCNAFSSAALAQRMLRSELRNAITSVLVPSLLHSDALVRTASASLAFNVAAVLQKDRVEAVRSGRGIQADSEDELGDWQVEMVSAVIEALHREKENEEVVHRLTAALAFFVRLSPHYETAIRPLLDVLQTKDTLKSKLIKGSGWTVEGGLAKKDVRKLVDEVATKLCP